LEWLKPQDSITPGKRLGLLGAQSATVCWGGTKGREMRKKKKDGGVRAGRGSYDDQRRDDYNRLGASLHSTSGKGAVQFPAKKIPKLIAAESRDFRGRRLSPQKGKGTTRQGTKGSIRELSRAGNIRQKKVT